MRPFDINLAKEGHSVCTRSGKEVRIICFDRKNSAYPIVALVEMENSEIPVTYSEQGYYGIDIAKHELDLMMVGEENQGFVNLYRREDGSVVVGETIYNMRLQAVMKGSEADNYITTTYMNWKE